MKVLIATLVVLLVVISGCHTETPVTADGINPVFETISLGDDLIYDHEDNLVVYDDFSIEFVEGSDYVFNVSTSEKLYSIALLAKEKISGNVYEIASLSGVEKDSFVFNLDYTMFPVVNDNAVQEFYLYFEATDYSENSSRTAEFGFGVAKYNLLYDFYNEFGEISDVYGTNSVDFRNNIGKLTFVQFHGHG